MAGECSNLRTGVSYALITETLRKQSNGEKAEQFGYNRVSMPTPFETYLSKIESDLRGGKAIVK